MGIDVESQRKKLWGKPWATPVVSTAVADDGKVREMVAFPLRAAQVQLNDAAMDAILKSHMVDPALLRADSFQAFYSARKAALLTLVERAMGKASAEANVIVADDEEGDEDEGDAA